MVKIKAEQFASRIGVESFTLTALHKALDRLPSLSERGPWLAGGAIRRTLLKKDIDSDFDFFFANEEQCKEFARELETNGASKMASNDKNQLYIMPSRIETIADDRKVHHSELKLQLINFQYYDCIESVLDSFDFTLCQFAYDGVNICMSEFALWDTERKKLVPHKISYGTASLRRVLKYTNQGFTVCGGALTEILNQVAANPSVIQGDTLYID